VISTRRSRSSCCGFWASAPSSGSVATRRWWRTSASSPRRTKIWRSWSPPV